MPDITMCYGNDCPMKDTCYRHTAEPFQYQSYFVGTPYKKSLNGEITCKYYMEE